MNIAIKKFEMPWEVGDAIPSLDTFFYRYSYDKCYVLNVNDYLSRQEVVEAAIKNSYFIATDQSNDINRRVSGHVDYNKNRVWVPKGQNPPPPFLGIFLGKIIPTLGERMPYQNLTEASISEIRELAKRFAAECFEPFLDFWIEVIPSSHPALKENGMKPVWMKIHATIMTNLWQPKYDELVSLGAPRTPALEKAINELAAPSETTENVF